MEIKTKYNINDKIAVKDYKDNIILTTINRIETYASDTNLDIKYITNYGVVNENQTIDINDFINELNNLNDKKQDNPIEVIITSFKAFDADVKPKYHIGELVEYNYNGELYISIIEDININYKNITYKLQADNRAFLEKEIKSIKLNVDDRILFFVPYEIPIIKFNKRGYYFGIITDICPHHIVVKTEDDYKVDVLYDQILKRI